MGATERTFTPAETMQELGKRATEADQFYLKVFRRLHMSQTPSLVATFSGARMEHFASPELWLPPLAGGGKFLLQGYHESDFNKPIGSYLNFSIDSDEPREVDAGLTKKADWRGPAKLEFPKEAPTATARNGDMPLYDVRSPPAPGSGDSATRSTAWARQAGGGVHREEYGAVESFGAQARALESERRQMERDKLEAKEEKHRAELDAVKKAHEADLRAMKLELMNELRAQRPTGPDASSTMLMEFFKQSAEDRRADATRAAEDRRLERDRQAAQDARFERLIEKMSERKEKDPIEVFKTVAELVGKKGNDSDVMMKSVHNMVEMQSSMMGAAMDFVDHASRMQLGGGDNGEPSWVKGVDRLMKGIGKMAQGAALRGAAVPGQVFPQPQLPAQQRAAQAPAVAPAPAAAQSPQAQAQPAPQAQAPQQPRPPQMETELSVVDQVILAIQAHHDPADVAAKLVQYYKDPSVQQAFIEAGGDFELAFKQRLGNWPEAAAQNKAYLAKLFEALEKEMQKNGFVVDEPDDEADDADDEEDAETDSEGDEGGDE